MAVNLNNFKCVMCGNCCRWSGYVRLREKEVDAIAEFLDMDVSDFIEQYTRLTDDRRGLSLTEKDDGSCIFFNEEESSCDINDVKPVQCRNFPYLWNFEGWENECEGGRKFFSENKVEQSNS